MFYGPPVYLIVTTVRRLELGSRLSPGMFIQTIMLDTMRIHST